ncbi:MAG TPA: hypothetical protein VE153_29440, partial [Myxococcus sp.]|nr:hypothetical protein [Myxococcus sp.]
AVFGFLWAPRWVDNTGAPARLDAVRAAFNNPTTAPGAKAAATQMETAARGAQSVIPMGPARSQILRAEEMGGFSAALRARAEEVFVHVSDSDTVSFNPQAGGGSPEALFQRFDRMLNRIAADIRAQAARGQRPSDGGAPIVATGGYQLQFQPDPGQLEPGQTADLRVQLSTRLDMAVRQAMASVDPRAVYFPEPNLLIQLTDTVITAGFGSDRYEARRLIANIEASGARPRLVFNLRSSMATAAPTRFAVEGGSVRSSWGQLRDLTEAELRGIIANSQSHADRRNWAHQVRGSYGLAPASLGPLFRLWETYFPVSAQLCGFEPARLRAGVMDRSFTSLPGYGQTSALREELLATLTRGSAATPRQTALVDRIIELGRVGGLGLANGLAAIFRRISSGG